MQDRVTDFIDLYMGYYGQDADEAVRIMKEELDAALEERRRQDTEGEQP